VAAIDVVVFFPEATLELQPHFQRCQIRQLVDGRLHLGTHIHRDLGEDGRGNGADAPFGFCGARVLAAAAIDIADCDASLVLMDAGHLAIIFDQRSQILAHGLADHPHAALGLEDGALQFIIVAGANRRP
jgi:hypothetical protein